jgi:hypothetical protein
MNSGRDIYDPPPAPLAWAPPRPEPLRWTRTDLVGLLAVCGLLAFASALAWRAEPTIGLLTALSGSLVVVESWFTALGFLHRRPEHSASQRLRIFLAALLPWAFGLGISVLLMVGLFTFSDRLL